MHATNTRTGLFLLGLILGLTLSGGRLVPAESGPEMTQANPQASLLSNNWLDPAWSYRIQFTADPTAISGDFTEFPLLIRLNSSHSSLFANAKSDGSDLVVTKSDGQTILGREIVTFDPLNSEAEIWFGADSLSTTKNTFYLYYANPDTSLPASDGSAWKNDFLGVYHFAEDPGAGILKDYGPRGNDATTGFEAAFTSSDTISGPIGQAWNFNGTTHWVDGDAISTSDSCFTVSAWFGCWNQFRDGDADFALSSELGFWHLSPKRNSDQRQPDFAISGKYFSWQPNPLPDTLSHHMVWAMDGEADTIRFYFDGVEQDYWIRYSVDGGPVYTGVNIGGNVGIASPPWGNSNPWDLMEGIVDEYRIMEGVSTPEWVTTEYRNQTQFDFYTFGAPEPYSTTAVETLSFWAERGPDGARLLWELPENAPSSLFDVYREETGIRVRMTPQSIAVQRGWSFLDPTPPPGETTYWLAETTGNGDTRWYGPALLPASGRLPIGVLSQNQPNPFRASTMIQYRIGAPGLVRVRVFDTRGREIVTLFEGSVPGGEHQVVWDGKGLSGSPVAPGIYFYRLETPEGIHSRRMVRLR